MLLPLLLNNLMGGAGVTYTLSVSSMSITISLGDASLRKLPRPGDARMSRRGLEYP